MAKQSLAGTTLRFFGRRYCELITLLVCLFVLQTGLVPFDFSEAAVGGNRFGAAVDELTLPDIISNIFLYVPLGTMLYLCLDRVGCRRLIAWLTAVGLATSMSFAIEWIQAYSPSRVSSCIDLVSNGIGASIGATLAWTYGWLMPPMARTIAREFSNRPQATVLKVYGLLLITAAAVPFSFSFDVMRLKRSVQSAVWIPFDYGAQNEMFREHTAATSQEQIDAHARWWQMKRWSHWTVEWGSFALLAWLLFALLRNDYTFPRQTAYALVFWIGGLLAIGLSVIHLMVISRTCDVTDLLFRLVGLGSGLLARSYIPRARQDLTPAQHARGIRQIAKGGCVLVVIYIIYTGIIPLRFNFETGGPVASVTSDSFLPLFGYFQTRFDLMMDDAMEKFFVYGLFAALLATAWRRFADCSLGMGLATIAAAGVTLSVAIEIVQMFMPVRITSLTDPILAASGCLIGAVTQRQIAAVAQSLKKAPPFVQDQPPAMEQPTSQPSLIDVMMGSLADPRDDAPIEPDLSRQRRPQLK